MFSFLPLIHLFGKPVEIEPAPAKFGECACGKYWVIDPTETRTECGDCERKRAREARENRLDRCAECDCILPEHWDHCSNAYDGAFPRPPVTYSTWVKRAQSNTLPTFDRHNGAYAYKGR